MPSLPSRSRERSSLDTIDGSSQSPRREIDDRRQCVILAVFSARRSPTKRYHPSGAHCYRLKTLYENFDSVIFAVVPKLRKGTSSTTVKKFASGILHVSEAAAPSGSYSKIPLCSLNNLHSVSADAFRVEPTCWQKIGSTANRYLQSTTARSVFRTARSGEDIIRASVFQAELPRAYRRDDGEERSPPGPREPLLE